MFGYLWVSIGGAIGSVSRSWDLRRCGRAQWAGFSGRNSMDLPIVIEILESEEKVNAFLPDLEEMTGGGLVTLEKIIVIHYRHERPALE